MKTVNLIGLSGGKDSTRLAGWAIHESGYPIDSLLFVFADTQNEYEEVYRQIDDLDIYVQSFGCKPIRRLIAEGKWVDKYWMFPRFLALAIWKGRFPSTRARFCTDYLKIKPTEKLIKELKAEGFDVVSHSGVRKSESFERSLLEEWGKDMFSCKQRRPLLNETINDVWKAHTKYRLPINGLYKQGWKRVGCRLCVMSNKMDVARTVKKRPWVIEIYKQWEQALGEMKKSKGSMTDFSSWFNQSHVPDRFRSRSVVVKNGDIIRVPTVADVAAWSTTSRGGKDQLLDFMFDEDDFNVEDSHAPCKAGLCE